MTVEEAQVEVIRRWGPLAQEHFGCPAVLNPKDTKTYEWGWVLNFRAIDPDACRRRVKKCAYAIDRESGASYPLGPRGLRPALAYFEKVRARRVMVDKPVVVASAAVEKGEPGA